MPVVGSPYKFSPSVEYIHLKIFSKYGNKSPEIDAISIRRKGIGHIKNWFSAPVLFRWIALLAALESVPGDSATI